MAFKQAIFLLSCLLFANHVLGFSLSQDEFDKLVQPRCFNRSTTGQELVLGQNEPIGMSLENLISMIERLERLNPNLKPEQVLKMLLMRFHIDGVKFNGHVNSQSNLEYQHAELTRAILADNSESLPFPENQFTEDEKCNLFFTISHVVNETALQNENEAFIFWSMNVKTAKAPPAPAPARNLGDEVVLPQSTTPKAEQSAFLEDDEPDKDNSKKVQEKKVQEKKIQKRDTNNYVKNIRLTKRPREYGVASFQSSRNNPISVNRVLLGMLVGFTNSNNKKMSAILNVLQKSLKDSSRDKEIEPLLAVTLSDIYGIDTNEGMSNQNGKTIFGADGDWNNTVCHTNFVLSTEGNWATSAEFRGGLDGYNIGRYLPTLLKEYPDISASQVLRFYYSKNGLSPVDGVCKRDNNINSNIKDDLKNDATNYLVMWNSVFYANQYSFEKIEGYIQEVEKHFTEILARAAVLNEDENSLCNQQYFNDIKSKPIESNVDALFLLDITLKCSQDVRCSQAAYVQSLSKNLKLGRNFGSVSVLFNARGVESPNLIDDEMRPVVTPLFSNLYNSTSNECAACKASNYDSSSRELITDRVELASQLNLTLGTFEEKRLNDSGVPAKAVFWIDFGTVKPAPSDKIQKVKYETVKRHLLSVQRDFTFFGLATNTSNLKDIVLQEGNLVSVDPNEVAVSSRVSQLSQKILEVPSVFQYNDCRSRASNNYTYQGFITPGYKQYWAMFPDTFRSSSSMQLKFSAETTPIQVCYSRVIKPELADQNCKKATKANEEVSWVVYSPCKDTTFEKCSPLYFTVTIDKSDSAHCKDQRCQNIDQVKWSFSHTGVLCSRSYAISISLFLIMFTSIFSFSFNRNAL